MPGGRVGHIHICKIISSRGLASNGKRVRGITCRHIPSIGIVKQAYSYFNKTTLIKQAYILIKRFDVLIEYAFMLIEYAHL